MISYVAVNNFKGLKDFQLEDMSRLTLLSGRNNVGKSSILEAMFLYRDHVSSDSFNKLHIFRGNNVNGTSGIWDPFFYGMNTSEPIVIKFVDEEIRGELKYSRDDSYLPNNITGIPENVLATFRSANKEAYSLKFDFKEGEYMEEGHFSTSGAGTLRDLKTSLEGNEIRLGKATQINNSVSVRIQNNVVDGISKLEMDGRKKDLIDVLRQIDSTMEDVITLSVAGEPKLYARINNCLVPLHQAGDGLIKLLTISVAVMTMKDGLLLIDEIENGFHYSMYGKLWNIVDELSKITNCQIVATTHSYELITSTIGNIKAEQDFSYYRIGKIEEKTSSYRYDYSMLCDAASAEMEVR